MLPSAAEITEMRAEDVREVHGIVAASMPAPWTAEMILEELGRDWAHVWVLRDRGEGPILSVIDFWLVADELHVLNLATLPSARRRGYAERLMSEATDYARRHGASVLTLEVRASNQTAIALYQKLEFLPIGVRRKYYSDGEDALVMMRSLRRSSRPKPA